MAFSHEATPHGLVYEHAKVPTFTLAYYFSTLMEPRHPDHAMVKAFAEEVIARAHEEKMAKGRESMKLSRASMTNEEWSLIVD